MKVEKRVEKKKKKKKERERRVGKRKERREESEVDDPLERNLYLYVREKETMRRKAANERAK